MTNFLKKIKDLENNNFLFYNLALLKMYGKEKFIKIISRELSEDKIQPLLDKLEYIEINAIMIIEKNYQIKI